MKITSETLPERQVLLEIEVEPERHQQAMEQAYKKLAPRVRIPGFRPGKAPRPMIERELGRHRLLDEAMDILVPKAYQEAVESEDLDPVANPSLELVSHEPFVFKATVPLRPSVDLGDYQSLRVERETATVTEEQVEEAITSLRRRYGTLEPVDRPAQKGDIIRGDLKAEADGKALIDQEEIEYRLTDEALATLPGLVDSVVGLAKGATLEHDVAVPEDFADDAIAGKTVTYKVAVHEVKEEKLAPLDDSFAKGVGEGFESVEALTERVRNDLQTSQDDAALHGYHDQLIEALLQGSTLEFPSVLIEREIDRILNEEANLDPRDPRAQSLYIARIGKSEEEVRAEVREAAEARLRRSLVLSQFAEAENIEVDDEDAEAEIQNMASQAGEQADSILRIFGTENGRDTIRRTLLTRRVMARLVEVGSGLASAESNEEGSDSGQDAEPAEAEPEASAAPKQRRSGPRAATE